MEAVGAIILILIIIWLLVTLCKFWLRWLRKLNDPANKFPAIVSSGTENLSLDTDRDKDVDNSTTGTEQIKTSVPNMVDDTIDTSTITQSVLVGGAIITLSPPTKTQKKEYIIFQAGTYIELAKQIRELARQGFTVTTMTQNTVFSYTVIMERDTVNKTNS